MAATLVVEPVNVPVVRTAGLNGVRQLAALVCVECDGMVLLDRDAAHLHRIAGKLARVHLCPGR